MVKITKGPNEAENLMTSAEKIEPVKKLFGIDGQMFIARRIPQPGEMREEDVKAKSSGYSTDPKVAPTPISSDPHDPRVKKIVYSMYRDMISNYHSKANDIIKSKDPSQVSYDAGIDPIIMAIISAQSGADDSRGQPDGTGPPAPPPPPPMVSSGHIPTFRLNSEIGQKQDKGPPMALATAMTKDKKPFTYTPGGIDLSEIKSPRMAKRIMMNAASEGVQPEVKQVDSETGTPIAPKATAPLPPSAMAAMQPQMAVPVFPQGGMSPSQVRAQSKGNVPPAPPQPAAVHQQMTPSIQPGASVSYQQSLPPSYQQSSPVSFQQGSSPMFSKGPGANLQAEHTPGNGQGQYTRAGSCPPPPAPPFQGFKSSPNTYNTHDVPIQVMHQKQASAPFIGTEDDFHKVQQNPNFSGTGSLYIPPVSNEPPKDFQELQRPCVKPVMRNQNIGSLYIPPVEQQFDPLENPERILTQTPVVRSSVSSTPQGTPSSAGGPMTPGSAGMYTPQLNKAPTPWMNSVQRRQSQPETPPPYMIKSMSQSSPVVPPWATGRGGTPTRTIPISFEQEASVAQNRGQGTSSTSRIQADGSRTIPIQIQRDENKSSSLHTASPSPVKNLNQVSNGTRTIPIQIEGKFAAGARSENISQANPQMGLSASKQLGSSSYNNPMAMYSDSNVMDAYQKQANESALSSAVDKLNVGGDPPRDPVQSKSLRIIQKVAENEPAAQKHTSDGQTIPIRMDSGGTGHGHQIVHRIAVEPESPGGSGNQRTHPSQQSVTEPKKYMGKNIPSRSFKILQAMTADNPDAYQFPTEGNYSEDEEDENNRLVATHHSHNPYASYGQFYPPPSPHPENMDPFTYMSWYYWYYYNYAAASGYWPPPPVYGYEYDYGTEQIGETENAADVDCSNGNSVNDKSKWSTCEGKVQSQTFLQDHKVPKIVVNSNGNDGTVKRDVEIPFGNNDTCDKIDRRSGRSAVSNGTLHESNGNQLIRPTICCDGIETEIGKKQGLFLSDNEMDCDRSCSSNVSDDRTLSQECSTPGPMGVVEEPETLSSEDSDAPTLVDETQNLNELYIEEYLSESSDAYGGLDLRNHQLSTIEEVTEISRSRKSSIEHDQTDVDEDMLEDFEIGENKYDEYGMLRGKNNVKAGRKENADDGVEEEWDDKVSSALAGQGISKHLSDESSCIGNGELESKYCVDHVEKKETDDNDDDNEDYDDDESNVSSVSVIENKSEVQTPSESRNDNGSSTSRSGSESSCGNDAEGENEIDEEEKSELDNNDSNDELLRCETAVTFRLPLKLCLGKTQSYKDVAMLMVGDSEMTTKYEKSTEKKREKWCEDEDETSPRFRANGGEGRCTENINKTQDRDLHGDDDDRVDDNEEKGNCAKSIGKGKALEVCSSIEYGQKNELSKKEKVMRSGDVKGSTLSGASDDKMKKRNGSVEKQISFEVVEVRKEVEDDDGDDKEGEPVVSYTISLSRQTSKEEDDENGRTERKGFNATFVPDDLRDLNEQNELEKSFREELDSEKTEGATMPRIDKEMREKVLKEKGNEIEGDCSAMGERSSCIESKKHSDFKSIDDYWADACEVGSRGWCSRKERELWELEGAMKGSETPFGFSCSYEEAQRKDIWSQDLNNFWDKEMRKQERLSMRWNETGCFSDFEISENYESDSGLSMKDRVGYQKRRKLKGKSHRQHHHARENMTDESSETVVHRRTRSQISIEKRHSICGSMPVYNTSMLPPTPPPRKSAGRNIISTNDLQSFFHSEKSNTSTGNRNNINLSDFTASFLSSEEIAGEGSIVMKNDDKEKDETNGMEQETQVASKLKNRNGTREDKRMSAQQLETIVIKEESKFKAIEIDVIDSHSGKSKENGLSSLTGSDVGENFNGGNNTGILSPQCFASEDNPACSDNTSHGSKMTTIEDSHVKKEGEVMHSINHTNVPHPLSDEHVASPEFRNHKINTKMNENERNKLDEKQSMQSKDACDCSTLENSAMSRAENLLWRIERFLTESLSLGSEEDSGVMTDISLSRPISDVDTDADEADCLMSSGKIAANSNASVVRRRENSNCTHDSGDERQKRIRPHSDIFTESILQDQLEKEEVKMRGTVTERKALRYQRAKTHSRLFQLLQEEGTNLTEEEFLLENSTEFELKNGQFENDCSASSFHHEIHSLSTSDLVKENKTREEISTTSAAQAIRRSRLIPLPLKNLLQSSVSCESTSSASGSSGVLSPTSPRDQLLADIINEFHLRHQQQLDQSNSIQRRRKRNFPSKIFKLLQDEFGEEFYQAFDCSGYRNEIINKNIGTSTSTMISSTTQDLATSPFFSETGSHIKLDGFKEPSKNQSAFYSNDISNISASRCSSASTTPTPMTYASKEGSNGGLNFARNVFSTNVAEKSDRKEVAVDFLEVPMRRKRVSLNRDPRIPKANFRKNETS